LQPNPILHPDNCHALLIVTENKRLHLPELPGKAVTKTDAGSFLKKGRLQIGCGANYKKIKYSAVSLNDCMIDRIYPGSNNYNHSNPQRIKGIM